MSGFISGAIIAILVIVDQVTKYLAVLNLKPLYPKSIPIIKDVFELLYVENRGIGFSLLQNMPWIFIPVSAVITVLVVLMMARSPMRKHPLFSGACAMIVAGAIGNMIDRVFSCYVVDFLYFKLINFPIFNFADCCVVVGAALLFIFILFCMKDDEETSLLNTFFGITLRGKKHE